MPSADSIELYQGGLSDHIKQLAQIVLPDGSFGAEAFYDPRDKKVLFQHHDVYYKFIPDLTASYILTTIMGLGVNIYLSQESWTVKGQLDYDNALQMSWKDLRRQHNAMQLYITEAS